jgi:hypothetical protein
LIDYVKIKLIDIDVERLLNLSMLDFKFVVSKSTGEVSSLNLAESNFCKIKVYDSGLVLFLGSIHKMWNSLKGIKAPNYQKLSERKKVKYRGFNGNQFTIDNIFEIRDYLQILFGCQPHQMIIQNIEFGVNTTLEFSPNLFNRGLLYHKGTMFESKHKRNFMQVTHNRYLIKLYNKSSQYGMTKHTLRIEVHYNRMEDLKKCGIRTFADINTNTLNSAKELLLERFEEIVYFDSTVNKKSLSKFQKRQISYYSNPRYWIDDLKPNHRDREKKRLSNMINYNSINLKKIIREDMIQKCVMINQHSKM